MWTEPISTAEWQAIWLSLRVGVWSTLLSLPLAIATAVLLERRRFWGRGLLTGLVYLPLVLPPVVTGYLLLIVFSRTAPFGKFLSNFEITLPFTPAGAVVAAAVMAFPLTVRSIQVALSSVDPKLEVAARTLGAGRWGVFWTVTLPLIRPGVYAGMILGFAKAMGEFGATITFVSNIPGQTQTIASAIYALLQVPGAEAAVIRLIVFSAALSLGALVASEYLVLHRRKQ